MFAGKVVRIGVSITSTAELSKAACERPCFLTRIMPVLSLSKTFYIHGPVHREYNLITLQQDATYSVYYISVFSSTYFGC